MAEKTEFYPSKIEKIGNFENAGYLQFLSPMMFSKGYFLNLAETRECLVKV